MKIKSKAAVLVFTALMFLAGCGRNADSVSNSAQSTASVNTSYDMAAAAEEAKVESQEQEASEAKSEQKLIITQNLTVETEEFESLLREVTSRVEELGGYIENSEISGTESRGYRYADFKIRIPADRREEFVSAVEQGGTVTYNSTSTEDITLTYVDVESHVKALRVEEETLLELLEKAEALSDVLEIRQELAEVRYRIESYESQLRVFDNQVDYSTVNLNVHEVNRETTVAKKGFWSEAGARFSDNLYFAGRSLRGFALWLIGSLPVLVLLGLIVWGIVSLVRWRKKKKREKVDAMYRMKRTDEADTANKQEQ